jgi:Tfp pilus assembly protein PilF
LGACGSTEKRAEKKSADTGEEASQASTSSDGDEAGPATPEASEVGAATAPRTAPDAGMYKRFNDARGAKNTKGAYEAAGEILARSPNDPQVLNGLAALAIDQGKYDLARLLTNKVLTRDPRNAAALNNQGVIELKADNLRQALVDFKQATASGTSRAAHANLGTIYLQYRNYQSASVELARAVELGDQSLETLVNAGTACKGAGQFDKAEGYFEKALAKDPNNNALLLNYSALLVENLNKPQPALKMLNKLRFSAHDPAIIERANQLAQKAQGSTRKESP